MMKAKLIQLKNFSRNVIIIHRDPYFVVALVKSKSRQGYHVTELFLQSGEYACSCEYFTFKRRECRHVRLLRESLKSESVFNVVKLISSM